MTERMNRLCRSLNIELDCQFDAWIAVDDWDYADEDGASLHPSRLMAWAIEIEL